MHQKSAGSRTEVIDVLGRVATCIAAGANRDLIVRLITRSTRQIVDCDFVTLAVDTGGEWTTRCSDGEVPTADRPLGPAMFLPLQVDGAAGWLCAGRFFGARGFADEELDVGRKFARHAAEMLEQDELRRRNSVLERVAEQWRVASELQSLAGEQIFHASVRLSGALAELGDERARDRVVDAIDHLDHAIKIIRQIAFGAIEHAKSPFGERRRRL
jgi:hypothetical protein